MDSTARGRTHTIRRMFEEKAEPDEACGKCGSVYGVISTQNPLPTQGRINCRVCGHILIEWDGFLDYRAKLKARIQPPDC
jgi:hypothetical protein